MRTYRQDAKTLQLPWPFTGRSAELERVRAASSGGRPGIVVTGPAGHGKTRLITEAVRGLDHARVTGTPEARDLPLAAFAQLLPDTVSLHRAVRALSGVRVLVVDDAQLLDETSAALVHQLAVHGRTRLIVAATDGVPAPGAVSRLWTGELLPRLPLGPLPPEDTARLLAGAALDPLTVRRLHQSCRGDLRLLRALLTALTESTQPASVPGPALAGAGAPASVPGASPDVSGMPTSASRRGLGQCGASGSVFGTGLAGRGASVSVPGAESAGAGVLGAALAGAGVPASASGAAFAGADVSASTHGAALGGSDVPVSAPGTALAPAESPVACPGAGLVGAGRLESVPGTGEWAWRGPLPVTAAVRERLAPALERSGPGERDILDRLAFAEPLPLQLEELDELDLEALERLEADGLIDVGEQGAVTLAHPLHGTALRATAGRLRARRLGRAAPAYGPALDAERRTLVRHMERLDVRPVPTPVGEWLVAHGVPLPARYAEARARFARLRGEVREAAAWAREGLRAAPSDGGCRTELRLAEGGPDEPAGPDDVHARYAAVRLGEPGRATGRLPAGSVLARHADALGRADGPALDRAAEALAERGFTLYAAEAYAQAARAHRDPSAARRSRTRAVALARRCQGASTPALAGLVLGELTARQRQIVTLAAAGLSNREIAEKLTLSVRTVGNHLYSAYTRLGTGDRTALPWLLDGPERETA
ncbi:LuxR family transcriptional regulator [Streptomyces sp. CSDS2]|uniref:helix-turn-helix transcriptional regulator n=1 Tax=Streptomyces sp. CSDS2 TaxID=3055051 RepID=UPI0025B20BD7|nr:LuxR family transcriptional regulator [Streptomyces sp. CSDS2]MDN3264853.1 LuxR family transcriptional regulator [Streptomyces sp. CSDS2]